MTSLTSLLLSFTDASGSQTATRLGVLLGGLVVLQVLAGSRVVDRALTRVTEWALRRYTRLNVRDYDKLLHIRHEYAVAEVEVSKDDWLSGRTLGQLALRDEGIMVLGLYRRTGSYIGVPRATTALEQGDRLVVYGADGAVMDLAGRPSGAAGDRAHRAAVQFYGGRGVTTDASVRD